MTSMIQELRKILIKEEAILKTGRFQELEALLKSKQELLESIDSLEGCDLQELELVKQHIAKNKSLLKASLDGVKHAQKTMNEFRQVRSCLSFYGENGAKVSIPTSRGDQLFKKS